MSFLLFFFCVKNIFEGTRKCVHMLPTSLQYMCVCHKSITVKIVFDCWIIIEADIDLVAGCVKMYDFFFIIVKKICVQFFRVDSFDKSMCVLNILSNEYEKMQIFRFYLCRTFETLRCSVKVDSSKPAVSPLNCVFWFFLGNFYAYHMI